MVLQVRPYIGAIEPVGAQMIDIAARITLFPLLAWQGYATRRRSIKLPDATGRREGVTGSGPDLHMLIVGDSSKFRKAAVVRFNVDRDDVLFVVERRPQGPIPESVRTRLSVVE